MCSDFHCIANTQCVYAELPAFANSLSDSPLWSDPLKDVKKQLKVSSSSSWQPLFDLYSCCCFRFHRFASWLASGLMLRHWKTPQLTWAVCHHDALVCFLWQQSSLSCLMLVILISKSHVDACNPHCVFLFRRAEGSCPDLVSPGKETIFSLQ